MKRLYFIRHGLSLYNEIGEFSGRLDAPLTDEGRDEIKKTAETIKNLDIDTIVTSPLDRALESAQIIAEVIEYPEDMILINDLFSERDYGTLEGTPYQPLAVSDDIEQVESVDDLVKRAEKGYLWLKELNANNLLVVGHGAMGKALAYVVSQDNPSSRPQKFQNAELVRLI